MGIDVDPSTWAVTPEAALARIPSRSVTTPKSSIYIRVPLIVRKTGSVTFALSFNLSRRLWLLWPGLQLYPINIVHTHAIPRGTFEPVAIHMRRSRIQTSGNWSAHSWMAACSGMVFVLGMEMVHQTSMSRLIVASQLHKAAPTLVLLAKLLQTRMLVTIPKEETQNLELAHFIFQAFGAQQEQAGRHLQRQFQQTAAPRQVRTMALELGAYFGGDPEQWAYFAWGQCDAECIRLSSGSLASLYHTLYRLACQCTCIGSKLAAIAPPQTRRKTYPQTLLRVCTPRTCLETSRARKKEHVASQLELPDNTCWNIWLLPRGL